MKDNSLKLSEVDLADLARVRQRIDDHPAAKNDHFELAEITLMGPNRLYLAFIQLYKVSIAEYRDTKRIELAKSMLGDQNQTLPAIAEKCGYPSEESLRNAFKKVYGRPLQVFAPARDGKSKRI
ncbi:helix-turn-helix transcriptional regulator [Pseudoflavitalea sp. X16]|uniref:helix-turn-helix domain-containing protein n=1 Tax=Paraflavitalea devenefica TaxID=2716334 RepID=UPI00141E6715|nr:AraC family transcriptional regulator [Paraflavitalea devenefica]NII26112.1 helix-turn-helix transcriptional regulator [Paraflavitalea devenefica]